MDKVKVDDPLKMVSGFPLHCKMCGHSFSIELVEKYDIKPYWEIPQWRNRAKSLIKKHYNEMQDERHQQYEFI